VRRSTTISARNNAKNYAAAVERIRGGPHQSRIYPRASWARSSQRQAKACNSAPSNAKSWRLSFLVGIDERSKCCGARLGTSMAQAQRLAADPAVRQLSRLVPTKGARRGCC